MEKGAIILGLNKLRLAEVVDISPIGDGWEGIEEVLTDQLSPRASYPSQEATVGIQIEFAEEQSISGLALLGTDIDGPVVLERSVNGSTWTLEGTHAFSTDAPPGCGRHICLAPLFGATGEYSYWRLRWSGDHFGGRKFVGSLIMGTLWQEHELADEGWRMEYIDSAHKLSSEGGQAYAGAPRSARAMTIPQSTLSSSNAFAVHQHGQILDIAAPTVSGGVTSTGTTRASAGSGVGGEATWEGLLFDDLVTRIDYRITQTSPVALRAANLNYPGGTILTTAGQGPSTFTVVFSEGPGNCAFEILKASVISASELSPDAIFVAAQSIEQMVRAHGTSLPVLFLAHPSDPSMGRVSGIYGYIRSPVRLQRGSGGYVRTELVIEEQR